MPVVSSSTGRTVTSGGYIYHIFTTTGANANNITFSTGGTVEYLIIAGGGAGGSDHGGGGGAGEVVYGTVVATAQNYPLMVGAGGTVTGTEYLNISTTNGGTSSGFDKTANGGGKGAGANSGYGSTGGSGGGDSGYNHYSNVNVPTAIYASVKYGDGLGFAGGLGDRTETAGAGGGGGGGGAGGVGVNALSNNIGGAGGPGTSAYSDWINAIASTMNTIVTGWSSKTISSGTGYIASGGSGGTWGDQTNPQYTVYASAVIGGGGAGGVEAGGSMPLTTPLAGTPNTGGGGGGGGAASGVGANGGSGLIVIRYYQIGNINALSLYLSGSLNNVTVGNPSYNVPTATSTLSTPSVSLYATNIVASGVGFAVNSDKRIKKNIQYLSPTDSYELLKTLKPASYQYVDFLKGTGPKYGYLAQEVESVLPYAVNRNTGYIPNIFEMVTIEDSRKIVLKEKTTETLGIGTKIQFYDAGNVALFRQVVEIVDEKTFIVNEGFSLDTGMDTVFLYGQEVADYRSIDTDQMNTVMLSAFQEIQNRLEKQEKEIADLKQK